MEPAGPCPLLAVMCNPWVMAEGSFLTRLGRGQRVVRGIGSLKLWQSLIQYHVQPKLPGLLIVSIMRICIMVSLISEAVINELSECWFLMLHWYDFFLMVFKWCSEEDFF